MESYHELLDKIEGIKTRITDLEYKNLVENVVAVKKEACLYYVDLLVHYQEEVSAWCDNCEEPTAILTCLKSVVFTDYILDLKLYKAPAEYMDGFKEQLRRVMNHELSSMKICIHDYPPLSAYSVAIGTMLSSSIYIIKVRAR